jgi:UDP-glucose:(heptosyl)LPS alpha-1,3-glucosyltransferase
MREIAVVIPKYGLVGGAEQFASELTEKLSIGGQNSFHVFANRWQSDFSAVRFHKIPIVSFPKFMTTISFAWFAGRRIRQNNVSLVHSHERIFSADLFTLHGIPHRYWVHSVRCKRMSLYDLATAWVEKKLVYEGHCSRFIAVSGLTRDIFLQEYPIDPDSVSVIHPGVNLSDYAGKSNARHAARKALNIRDDDPVIVFASMNFEIKGLDNIMLALARLKKQNKSVKLIVAGKGNMTKYEKLAKDAQISENIIFTGTVTKDKLIDLYLAGDLYMMLSRFDTFGMVVLEAMAAGLPVMISNRVGAKDLIKDEKNGFIIPDASDYDYIASRLTLLLDKKIRTEMSAAAHQTASENTWDKVAKKYSDLYDEVFAAKHRKSNEGLP